MNNQIRFSRMYFLMFLTLFGIEVLIALFVRDQFVRPFLGDVLVVVLLYCLFLAVLDLDKLRLAVGVWIFACLIEFAQYYHLVSLLGWQDCLFARVIIGSTFDWLDLIAYTIGSSSVYLLDRK